MTKNKPYQAVKPDVQLPKMENDILEFWDKNKVFEKTLSNKDSAKPYTFYDGPPFATGLPHYGHILAGVLKDIVPRYYTMKGYHVERRFGWDCHGLPVEYEINKTLKLDNRKQILAYGVDKYNSACRSIVQRYSTEWKKTVRRVGRWVDMENAYFTMNVEFMQSVWWVFQQLWNKGLIYEGYKVVPYSTGISTPLSNFEANLNYKTVQDPALTIAFFINNTTAILAWTTTPWTLPSNLALAVGKDLDYIKVKDTVSGKFYIFAKELLNKVYPATKNTPTGYELVEEMKGSALLGLKYEPLFSFFKNEKNAFQVIHSDHVTLDAGTGVVHIAPAFGEDDFYACQKAGISVVNPVDDDGIFTSEVEFLAGKKVKDADKEITAYLKKQGNLFKQDTIEHSYPYCWRTDTPLIYRAVSSWFVAVEKIKSELVKNNLTTHWIPEHLRDGRFGNWLENARDWAISRNRFWGTPLPIWRNTEGEVICVGSKAELEKLSGKSISDLHIEHVDSIDIPSPTGKSPLKRIEGVLDCWFESGSMPYAQWGFPYTQKEAPEEFLKKNFPADFIAEGLDQTRGWFYTLMVIGTALFDKAPFKNVIVNGLVLAEDGKKMSKSLKNYPDPMDVLEKHGADGLRLCLIDSPVVRAQELKFSENAVRETVRRILIRWWNAYSFYVSYANVDYFEPQGSFEKTPNLLDQWILSRLNQLIANTEKEMAEYRLYNVVPGLLQFIEDLTNTYIRFNRSHFWQEGMPEDKRFAYETLYYVLTTLSKIMAPFAPFMAEQTYQNLSATLKNKKLSVHLEEFPKFNPSLIKPELEEAVKVMDTLVMLGRFHREKISVRAKIPLKTLKVIHRNPNLLKNVALFERYFKEELNFQNVEYVSNEADFVQVGIKANFQVLGKRLGAKMKQVAAEIQKQDLNAILLLEAGKSIQILDEEIVLSEVEIRRTPKNNDQNISSHQLVTLWIDPTVEASQLEIGNVREVIRKVQQARKEADLQLDDRIVLSLVLPEQFKQAVQNNLSLLSESTLAKKVVLDGPVQGKFISKVELDDKEIIEIGITIA